MTDASTTAISANGRVNEVILDDDRALPADVFLVAAGIVPNAALARAARLHVRRGILVDERMRTADPAIFACGDVAEPAVPSPACGRRPSSRPRWRPTTPWAGQGVRRLRAVTILKVVGIELTSIGRFEAQSPSEEVIALEDEAAQKYRKLVIGEDGGSSGPSCWATRPRCHPCAPRSRAAGMSAAPARPVPGAGTCWPA